jgi:hypothetical protein
MVYRCISVYTKMNQVIISVGRNIAIYPRSIMLTYSQIELEYTYSHPQLSQAPKG